MGWSRGADVAQELWDNIEDFIPPVLRQEVAEAFVTVFENHDCDTMCETEVYDIAQGNDPLYSEEEDCECDCFLAEFDEMDEEITPAFSIDCCPHCGGLQLDDVAPGLVQCMNEDCGSVFAIDDAELFPIVVECGECGSEDTVLVGVCECGAFNFSCQTCGNQWEETDLEIEIEEI